MPPTLKKNIKDLKIQVYKIVTLCITCQVHKSQTRTDLVSTKLKHNNILTGNIFGVFVLPQKTFQGYMPPRKTNLFLLIFLTIFRGYQCSDPSGFIFMLFGGRIWKNGPFWQTNIILCIQTTIQLNTL